MAPRVRAKPAVFEPPMALLSASGCLAGLAGLDALDLPDDAKTLFLTGNARRVFGLQAA